MRYCVLSISAVITALAIARGELDRAEEDRSLAGLVSDIFSFELKIGVPFGLEMHLEA